MSMRTYTQIQYHVDDSTGVCTVSMDRPNLRNAISRVMTYELDQAFMDACDDPRVRVIVLRGNGDHFSSGHDLGSKEHITDLANNSYASMGYPGPAGDYKKWYDLDVEMCLKWRQLSKPLLAGVKGYVIYHGCAIMSCADIVIAADDVKIMPSLVEYTSLPWDLALNAKKVKEIMMLQRFVLADEAEQLGLVNRVVPAAALDEELVKMAAVIAKASPFHLRMMKLSANQALDNAGMTTHVRSTLSHWAAYRWDWSEQGHRVGDSAAVLTVDHGGTAKRLAPVSQALKDDVMYWSNTAATASRQAR